MADTVLYAFDDGLATVTINRPEAMNALDTPTKVALRDAMTAAKDDPAVRAVLLTGAGERAFCVGQDLKEHVGKLAEARRGGSEAIPWGVVAGRREGGSEAIPSGVVAGRREGGGDAPLSTVREHYNPLATAIAGMRKPVVAAVNGVAAGAGAALAWACDFRILADHSGFNTSFAGVALTADSGASWTLPRLVGQAKAAELLMFPQTVPAAEALALGLAHRVVPGAELAATALAFARTLAEGPTVAYGAIKESLAFGASHSLVETLAKEDELQTEAGASADHWIAVQAFLAKEKPKYVGR